MNRSQALTLTLALAWSVAGSTTLAGSPQAEVATRAWAITDTVLARHVEPPTRQEMLLAGIKAVAREGHDQPPNHLAQKISNLANPNQLATLLTEAWADSKLIDEDRRNDVFFEGLLSVVPGHATLMSAKERKVNESFEANLYVGIQVALGLDEKATKPVFQQILEGGPAEHMGLKAGDLIEAIDGVSAEGMPLGKVVDRLRGEEGTGVLVKYSRPATGEVFEKSLTRSRLPRPTIQGLQRLPGKHWQIRLDGPSPIGYLKITEISGSTPFELRSFAEQLEAGGAKALILDLRDGPVGGFHPTILLADALLDGGTIGRVVTSDGERVIKAEPDALFRDWPIVVLIDGYSTGEVAWLVDALADNKRATIVGTPIASDSFVREMVAVPGGEWSVQMATGRLARGNGEPVATIMTDAASGVVNNFLGETMSVLERLNKETAESNDVATEAIKQIMAHQKDVPPDVARQVKEKLDAATASRAAVPSSTARPVRANRAQYARKESLGDQLVKAREILEPALKSAGK